MNLYQLSDIRAQSAGPIPKLSMMFSSLGNGPPAVVASWLICFESHYIFLRLEYQRNDTTGQKYTIILPSELRSYDFTNLTEGTSYKLWITSIGKDSESAPRTVEFHTRIYNFRRPESCVHVSYQNLLPVNFRFDKTNFSGEEKWL